MKRWMLVAIALSLNSAACPPAPSPPAPDASDASALGDSSSSCAGVCGHLAEIGCIEAADVECSKSVCLPIVSPKTRACFMASTTKEAARACGQIHCP